MIDLDKIKTLASKLFKAGRNRIKIESEILTKEDLKLPSSRAVVRTLIKEKKVIAKEKSQNTRHKKPKIVSNQRKDRIKRIRRLRLEIKKVPLTNKKIIRDNIKRGVVKTRKQVNEFIKKNKKETET